MRGAGFVGKRGQHPAEQSAEVLMHPRLPEHWNNSWGCCCSNHQCTEISFKQILLYSKANTEIQPFSNNTKQFRSILHLKRALSATVLLILVGWCSFNPFELCSCVEQRKIFNNATTLIIVEKNNRFTSNLTNQADKVIGKDSPSSSSSK